MKSLTGWQFNPTRRVILSNLDGFFHALVAKYMSTSGGNRVLASRLDFRKGLTIGVWPKDNWGMA